MSSTGERPVATGFSTDALAGQVAMVTGGGSGIGAAAARGLAAAGAKVAVLDLDPATGGRVAGELDACFIAADVAEPGQTANAVAEVVRRYGRIDVLVNNAGITEFAALLDIGESHWDRIHAVNSRGLFFCLQAAAREMVARNGGSIVNVSSISARGYRLTSSAAYSSSKGSVLALTRTAALQLAEHNVRVNAICPGVTLTSILDEWRDSGEAAQSQWVEMLAGIPLGRPNLPEHIAALAVFLATDGASTITGQTFTVDGGILPS
jgi:NAD(P)-dependent dehydrogenase (short-subunit alcohol dehydrogenase family)